MALRSALVRPRRVPTLAACALAAALCLPAAPSMAQEQYQLQQQHWQKQPTYPPDSPQGQLQAIRRELAEFQALVSAHPDEARAHADRAQDLAEKWIADHPNSDLMADALLLHGNARAARRHYYNALEDYEQVIRRYPASPQFQEALRHEFQIAKLFINGMRRRFLGMRILTAYSEGEELLIRIQERSPGSALGEEASITLANYYYRDGQMYNAAQTYDIFLKNYPRSPRREEAMLRAIQANLARFKGPRFDPTGLIEARQRLRTYRRAYPAAADRMGVDALLVRIDESLAMKQYLIAGWEVKRDNLVSAAYLYQRLVKAYPRTAAAGLALEQLAKLPANVRPRTGPGAATRPGS